MELIIKQIHKVLIKKGLKVAVAESCTGGIITSLLTELPGSSQYFILGIVTYSNLAKIKLLKIPASIIKEKGAVSNEVASLMAKSIRLLAKVKVGIGVTGIAGPGGGSKEKPQGTVFIAIDTPTKKIYRRFKFKGNRQSIRKQAALMSLELLKEII